MISWRMLINGRTPDDWIEARDDCWFPDFDHQEYLLPCIDKGDIPIDPYGSTVFQTSDLIRLLRHIEYLPTYFKSKPAKWSVSDESKSEKKAITLERDKIVELFDKTILMVLLAIESGGTIVFGGD